MQHFPADSVRTRPGSRLISDRLSDLHTSIFNISWLPVAPSGLVQTGLTGLHKSTLTPHMLNQTKTQHCPVFKPYSDQNPPSVILVSDIYGSPKRTYIQAFLLICYPVTAAALSGLSCGFWNKRVKFSVILRRFHFDKTYVLISISAQAEDLVKSHMEAKSVERRLLRYFSVLEVDRLKVDYFPKNTGIFPSGISDL